MKTSEGFTLVEVLVAVMILAVLSTFTAQTVTRSLRDKARLQNEIDNSAQLQNTLRLIEQDVNAAFHYRDINQEIEKAIKQAQQPPPPPNPGFPPAAPPPAPNPNPAPAPLDFEAKDYKNLTQFIGDEKSMNFTSLSHVRTMKDSQESDQQEVGYYLEDCKNKNKETVKCLWRRSCPYIDEDVTKGGTASVLLTDVSQFKLRYFGQGKLDWVSDWKTDERGDTVTKENFPQAVEITLAVKLDKKESTLATVIPIYFPANKSKDEPPPTPQPGAPSPNGKPPGVK